MPARSTITRTRARAVPELAAIRAANIAKVVAQVRRRGPIPRTELSALTGLTRPTITAVVTKLLTDGVLEEVGSRASGTAGGRPGKLLGFNPACACVAIARVRPDWVEAQVANVDGTVVVTGVRDCTGGPQEVFGELARLVESLVDQAASGPLGGLVAILPGELDDREGTVDFPVFGWDRIPVTAWLRAQLDVPVELVGPPRASAVTCIADGLCPEGKGLMVYVGLGVSVSIIDNWTAIAPSLGGGELGHCTIPGTTGVCSCGRVGCLGLSASGFAVGRDLTEGGRAQYAELPLRELSELRDPVVDEVLTDVAKALGLGISWLLNITGSRPVVIGGSHYAAGAAAFRAMVADAVKTSVPRHLAEDLTVVGCREDSTTTGAIQMALQLLPTHLRPPAQPAAR